MKSILSFFFITAIISSGFSQSIGVVRLQLQKKASTHPLQPYSNNEKAVSNGGLEIPQHTFINDADWQNNPTVAINRKASNLIAVAADDDFESGTGMPVYLSDDGGKNWTTFRLPRIFSWDPFGYPVITADNEGRFYYMYNVYNWTDSKMSIFVGSSTDGVHWKYGSPVVDTSTAVKKAFEYRPAITADNNPASPYYGRVYVVSMHLDTDDVHTQITLRRSDDHAKTWVPVVSIPFDMGGKALQIHTGGNGEVFIGYSTFGDSAGIHYLLVSKDGGVTFAKHIVAGFQHYPQNGDPQESLKGQKGITASASIAFSIDGSSNRINAVYGTWKKWDSLRSSAALYFRSSSDFGVHWSDSILLGSKETLERDRFFPCLSYDASLHETSILYYSSEQDTANIETTGYRSTLVENIPGPGIPIDSDLFDPLLCYSNLETTVGDYIGCDADNGVFSAAWTTYDYSVIVIHPGQNGHCNILLYVNSPTSSVPMPVKVNADRIWLSAPFPDPDAREHAQINFTIPSATPVSLSLFDESGKKVRDFIHRDFQEGSYTETLDMSGYASGNYFLQLQTEYGIVQTKLVLLH